MENTNRENIEIEFVDGALKITPLNVEAGETIQSEEFKQEAAKIIAMYLESSKKD